jgi:ATP phosphoribosyltransferase
LREVAPVLASEAVLAGATAPLADARAELVDLLLRRLDGVLAVRDSRLLMLHAPRTAVAEITRLLPGEVRPSIMPLEGSNDEVALQAVCLGAIGWTHLEAMKRAGAHSLLVLPVEKMLA